MAKVMQWVLIHQNENLEKLRLYGKTVAKRTVRIIDQYLSFLVLVKLLNR